jgi:hypothetical protein
MWKIELFQRGQYDGWKSIKTLATRSIQYFKTSQISNWDMILDTCVHTLAWIGSHGCKKLSGNSSMRSFFGWKLHGKDGKAYPGHFKTLKLWVGPLQKLPFLIIRVLRIFIFLKAFPSQFTYPPLDPFKCLSLGKSFW